MRPVRHRLLEPAQLGLESEQVLRAREGVLAQGQPEVARGPLVVKGNARALRERELAALERRLTGDRAQQRRLAGAVRPRERQPVAPAHGERDAVEERVPGELLAEACCDENGHVALRGRS